MHRVQCRLRARPERSLDPLQGLGLLHDRLRAQGNEGVRFGAVEVGLRGFEVRELVLKQRVLFQDELELVKLLVGLVKEEFDLELFGLAHGATDRIVFGIVARELLHRAHALRKRDDERVCAYIGRLENG